MKRYESRWLWNRQIIQMGKKMKRQIDCRFYTAAMHVKPLQLLVKFTRRARDENASGNTTLAILNALHDARRLAALGAIRALGGIHHLLAVCCFCNLGAYCHVSVLLISRMCAASPRIFRGDCGQEFT